MGFFDSLFGGADKAAQDQINAIQQGLGAAKGNIAAGDSALNTNYAAALQPYLQNYSTAQQGVSKLGDLLGLNGAAGSQNAQAALTAMPGYSFTVGQGNNAINAAAAANGTLGSGNQALALQKFGQQAANTNYSNYVSQLQPYLTASATAASGIGDTYKGLGNMLNANQNTLANLNVGAYTGIGNAQASADLANQGMGLGALFGALGFGSSSGWGGSMGKSLVGGLGTGAFKLMTGGGLSPIFSDERLKENVSPVGELYDGTQVYRYNYKGDGTPHIGVMAQEIEKKYPDAVTEFGGLKAVDYGKATDMASELRKFVDAGALPRGDGGFAAALDRFR
ncbi:hypothetical protein M2323_004030 [Rhodoblastus acidophilus]|uniref:tail fiber domain-containing protein n=1 Tax=Rhodoblastus acidophilus TaxID=1074 RepID=UPI0022253B9D|nr:tail fiber domain-containing protein [Rhodoblastus acidophilus]MCW2286231.1 hypothetical protein [Rhodoblastus acidophilus]MCW2335086.1 hypothetical protein [Rhodoblastus acidophilus]